MEKIEEIPLSLIDFPPVDLRFYRDDGFLNALLEDIEKNGILVPPIVQKLSNGRFLIEDGINRIKCAKKLGWIAVNCVITSEKTEPESLICSLKINLKRSSHDPVGVCEAFRRLHETHKYSQKQIAYVFGLSRAHTSKLIAIARNLTPENKLKLAKGELSIQQAYALAKTPHDPEVLENLDIKYRCESCNAKVPFHLITTTQICSHCKELLSETLKRLKRKLESEKSQKELPL